MMWGTSFNAMLIFAAILLTSIAVLQVDTTTTDGSKSTSSEPIPESLVHNELYHTYFKTFLYSTVLVPKTVVEKLLDATLKQPEIKDFLTLNSVIKSQELCACLSYLLIAEATLFDHFTQYPHHNNVFKKSIQLWKDRYVTSHEDYSTLTPQEIKDNVANEIKSTPKITSAIDGVIIESMRPIKDDNKNKDNVQAINYELLRSTVLIKITKYMTIVSQPLKKKDILLKVSSYLENNGIGVVFKSSGLSDNDIIRLRSYLLSV